MLAYPRMYTADLVDSIARAEELLPQARAPMTSGSSSLRLLPRALLNLVLRVYSGVPYALPYIHSDIVGEGNERFSEWESVLVLQGLAPSIGSFTSALAQE